MRFFALPVALLLMVSVSTAKDEFKVTEFVNQHLNSIGTEQARAAVKNRVVQGTVTFEILTHGPLTYEGPATLVSEGDQLTSLMKFPPTVFRTEWFVSNGKKTSIAWVKPGSWTAFGDFVRVHDEILTEGLWGGALSTAWALSHLQERRARLEDRGLKKVDGVELHRVDYVPKKNSDLEIQLYFEPDTFRHVMTVYLMVVTAELRGGPRASGNEQEGHYRLEERFGDFKSVDNLTLPAKWTTRFTYGTAASGTIDKYDVTVGKISHNVTLDPKNFEIK
ncbi:MAG: hypothetical protein WAN65_00045 [Candidatus Sulfotelmatobacter sp.]